MTDTTRRDPLASTGALTPDERASLARQPQWLSDLLNEQLLAEHTLAETPSVTGRPLP